MEVTLRLQIQPQQMVFRQWVVAAADPAVILLRPKTEEMVDPEVVCSGTGYAGTGIAGQGMGGGTGQSLTFPTRYLGGGGGGGTVLGGINRDCCR